MSDTTSDPVHIALTGMQEFWDRSRPIVLIGPWCRSTIAGSDEKTSFSILPRHWTSHEEVYEANKYIEEVYEKVLPTLADCLNEIHGISKSTRYWRIVVGYTFLKILHILYDRTICLKKAFRKYPNANVTGISPSSYQTPHNHRELHMASSFLDEMNLQLFSQAASYLGVPIVRRRLEWTITPKARPFESSSPSQPLGLQIKDLIDSVSNVRTRGAYSPIALRIPGRSLRLLFRIALATRLEAWPAWKLDKFELHSPEAQRAIELRQKFQALEGTDSFSTFALRSLRTNMPYTYIEHYNSIVANVEQRLDSHTWPRAIISNHIFDSWGQVWQAECMERGATLIGVQHGGNYGESRYSLSEQHEKAISDKFITWGWREDDVRDIPLPAPKLMDLSSEMRKDSRVRDQILWVGGSVGNFIGTWQYVSNLSWLVTSSLQPEQCWSKMQKFYLTMSPELRGKLLYRYKPISSDQYLMHSEQAVRTDLQDSFPSIDLDDYSVGLIQRFLESRLVVIDHFPSTSFLEAITLGKPVVVFGGELSNIRSSAQPFYEALVEVDVLHEMPEKAAQTINSIYEDVETWWKCSERQDAIDRFSRRFARTSPTAIEEWVQFVRRVQSDKYEASLPLT